MIIADPARLLCCLLWHEGHENLSFDLDLRI